MAYAISAAVVLRERAVGLTYRHPSENYIYACARAWFQSWDSLADTGCYIRAGCGAVRHHGAPDELAWPSTYDTINTVPSVGAMTSAYDRRGLSYYAVDEMDELDGVLEAGIPVVFGMEVTTGFMQERGGRVIDKLKGSKRGGHAMVIVERTASGNYWVLNSWGVGWADLGWGCLSSELVKWRARDMTAITGWSRLREAS